MSSVHVFAPFAGVALLLLLAVIPWHLRAKNLAVLLLSGWLFVITLCLFVNAVLWWDDADIKATAWCEISTRIIYAGQVGPVCCCLCVLRRLESIASTRSVRSTAKDRRKHIIWDIAIGIGIPLIFTGLYIVNQGHRFDIIEGIGCTPTIYWTPMAIVFNLIPPLSLSIAAVIYGALALRWFIIRRRQFNAVLQASCSHINKNRYLRLMLMASTEVLVSFPINIATFTDKLQYQRVINPWISWDDTHYGFGFINQITLDVFVGEDKQRQWRTLEIGRWGIVIGAILVFLFFVPSEESVHAYGDLLRTFVRLGKQTPAKLQHLSGLNLRLGRRARDRQQPTPPMVAIETAWQIDSEPDYEKKHGVSDDDLAESKSALSEKGKATRV